MSIARGSARPRSTVTTVPVVTWAMADVVELLTPGAGFTTVTVTLPACDALAVPEAVSSVAETNVVVSAVVPNITCAPLTKPLPFT